MTVIGLVASMIYMDWLLSLLSAVLYPLAAVPIQRIGKRVRRASGGMQETIGETAAMLNESFAQARTVRAYRLEEIETKRGGDGVSLAVSHAAEDHQNPFPRRAGAGGAGRHRGRRWSSPSRPGGPPSRITRWAILAPSSPRCCWRRGRCGALGSLNSALQEGLAGLVRVFAVIDEPARIQDAPGASRCRPGMGMCGSSRWASSIRTAASASTA